MEKNVYSILNSKVKLNDIRAILSHEAFNVYVDSMLTLLSRDPEADIPSLELGWDDSFTENYNHATNLPVVVDSYDAVKAFPVHFHPEDFEANFTHYCKNLILRYDMADALGIDYSVIRNTPPSMLGYKSNLHHGVEEFGTSLTTDDAFPDFIVEAAVELVKRRFQHNISSGTVDDVREGINLSDYMNVRASLPRGKNTGLPWMASGSDRFMNDLVLTVNAGLAKALVEGVRPEDMFKDMLQGYVVFSRYQRSRKRVPITLMGGQRVTCVMVEPRRRMINSVMKAVALALKPFYKYLTVHCIVTPEFMQDRDKIHQFVIEKKFVQASDASRFDLRSGGVKMEQAAQALISVVRHFHPNMPQSIDHLVMYELQLPTLVDVGHDRQFFTLSHDPSLKSGASGTSRVGSMINLMYDMYVTAKANGFSSSNDLVNHYVSHCPSMILGDDLLKGYNDKSLMDKYIASLPSLADVGMSAELEVPTKFLGYYIYPDGHDGVGKKGLYHSSATIDNMLFPERFGSHPIASVGARYVIGTSSNYRDALDNLKKFMTDHDFFNVVRREIKEKVLPVMAKHYVDHPNGSGRLFFNNLMRQVEQDDTFKNLQSKEGAWDEIIDIIAHNSSLDFNPRLIGVDLDLEDEEVNKDVVNKSIVEILGELDALKSRLASEVLVTLKPFQLHKLRSIVSLFDRGDNESFVRRFRSLLPSISREINTPFGVFYSARM